MKIAVSAKGKSLSSPVDIRFGRCSGFVLFDTDTGNADYLDNSTQRELKQGAGVGTVQMIAEAGTQVLITGQLGPKAAKVLGKSGIDVYACSSGTVQEAVRSLEQNKLKVLSDETIQPGPGKMGGQGLGGGGRGRGPSQGGRGKGGGMGHGPQKGR
jgi:predicted Fe-Mo cluster-binding NifX family protein